MITTPCASTVIEPLSWYFFLPPCRSITGRLAAEMRQALHHRWIVCKGWFPTGCKGCSINSHELAWTRDRRGREGLRRWTQFLAPHWRLLQGALWLQDFIEALSIAALLLGVLHLCVVASASCVRFEGRFQRQTGGVILVQNSMSLSSAH